MSGFLPHITDSFRFVLVVMAEEVGLGVNVMYVVAASLVSTEARAIEAAMRRLVPSYCARKSPTAAQQYCSD